MQLRLRLAVVFAICISIPVFAGMGAIALGARYSLREDATGHLHAATASILNSLEDRLAMNLANLKAWSALPVMQDALIADDGGDIARVLDDLKARYPDFASLTVTDTHGAEVATTASEQKGADLAADEGIRAAASGRVFQSAFGLRSTGGPETIRFTVPLIASYDRQTVIGTLTGVLDFNFVAKAVMAGSVLAATDATNTQAIVLERRSDSRIVFASRADANLLQALNQIEDRKAGTTTEISWDGKAYFVTTAVSKGKGMLRDPQLVARGIAPTDSIFTVGDNLSRIFAVAAGAAVLIAMYIAWRWTSPLVQLTEAMTRLARGDTRWRAPSVSPQHTFGEMARSLEVFRQTKIVRDRVAAREQELHHAKEEAEAAALAKSEHLASLSRELRTQLNAIVGLADLINRDILGTAAKATYADYAKDIGRCGVQLLAVINDLFDLSEAEAGHLTLNESVVDIAEIVLDSVRPMREAARNAKVAISCEGCDVSMRARVDRQMLKQVLLKLLSNAVKFTPANGRVRVSVKVSPEGCPTIAVEDNGIGMNAKLGPVALAPFGASADASSHGRHGAGLSLPLVRRLVDMHQGSVEIESEIGKGTTVIVTLPADRLVERRNSALERLSA